ncbi:PEP-CTERM sorting domain-containing protein [Nitrosomonas sp.]|uniref:PEP-CTERM sorting domain-containing protein n=1 Tax=Nitrosomonas sp. TaxID=42353 RepID=UPI003451E36E
MFYFGNGFQDLAGDVLWINYAWAVHDGDVAAIPEPEMYAMMVLGLAVLLGFGRLRQH